MAAVPAAKGAGGGGRRREGPCRPLFRVLCPGCRRFGWDTVQHLWQEGLTQCALRLNREDGELLEQLGPVLGRYDGDSQRQAVEGVLVGLHSQQAQAEEDRRRLGRVYGVLGITAGLFLTIMLI